MHEGVEQRLQVRHDLRQHWSIEYIYSKFYLCRSSHPIAEQDCGEFVALLATTDRAEDIGLGEEDEGNVVIVAREKELKDNDVGAVDPEGGLTKSDDVGTKVDAGRNVTRDEVSARVDSEVGAKVTDDSVVWVHRENEV